MPNMYITFLPFCMYNILRHVLYCMAYLPTQLCHQLVCCIFVCIWLFSSSHARHLFPFALLPCMHMCAPACLPTYALTPNLPITICCICLICSFALCLPSSLPFCSQHMRARTSCLYVPHLSFTSTYASMPSFAPMPCLYMPCMLFTFSPSYICYSEQQPLNLVWFGCDSVDAYCVLCLSSLLFSLLFSQLTAPLLSTPFLPLKMEKLEKKKHAPLPPPAPCSERPPSPFLPEANPYWEGEGWCSGIWW